MLIHLYRLKHKPTGLYYAPGEYSNLSEKGKVYSGGNNVLNFYGNVPFTMSVFNQKTIKKYRDKLAACGQLKKYGEREEVWSTYQARKEDFEIETLTFVER
jgi:hypothetical protein